MPRRGIEVGPDEVAAARASSATDDLDAFDTLDRAYRALCAILYNYVPTSGHPGGSISSGRIVAGVLFDALDLDLAAPERQDNDVCCYAAGHKAMGLYAMWAARDEVARRSAPRLVPDDARRLRLEDLLGFRTNPARRRPLAQQHQARALDGHPTPATPFVRVASGASGVGMASAIGLAIAARDRFGADCPRIHVVEGEGGLTPGRVSEALAAAATAALDNVVVHVDFNQASIDSDHVCRDADGPGDYVQWEPGELFALHDWNVVRVEDGHDMASVLAAQRLAAGLATGQPTAVVYRTTKGWHYGIEGRASHGAGHALCSEGFHLAVRELGAAADGLATCPPDAHRCDVPGGDAVREGCFLAALETVRDHLRAHDDDVARLAERLEASRARLDRRARRPRPGAPDLGRLFAVAEGRAEPSGMPPRPEPGTSVSLRETLGRALGVLSASGGGAMLVGSADLLGSTSALLVADGSAPGFFHATDNPDSRRLSVGGICEDGLTGVLSGLSAFGAAIGVGASYAAFLAPLGHVAARLHAIGAQSRSSVPGEPFAPIVLICGHAGLATGEDGPTHADPQALQLLASNFPGGACLTLTPFEPQEVWPLLCAALARRPAVIAPFVPRPAFVVPDRAALGLAPACDAVDGLYLLRAPVGDPDVVVVLQEAAVTTCFVSDVLPRLVAEGVDVAAYSVASAELFDALDPETRRERYPEHLAARAMGITGFTLPTMWRWVPSEAGRAATLHPFRDGRYPGSGGGAAVLEEAGLGPEAQYAAVRAHLDAEARATCPL